VREGLSIAAGHHRFLPPFIQAYQRDVASLDIANNLSYFLRKGSAGRMEAFAEIFAEHHGEGTGWSEMKKHFSECWKLVGAAIQ
jgi:hypothetical protein